MTAPQLEPACPQRFPFRNLDLMVTEIPSVRTLPRGPAWCAAEAYGCDMDLLSESLTMTPAERLRLHTIALRRLQQLETAKKGTRSGPGSSA